MHESGAGFAAIPFPTGKRYVLVAGRSSALKNAKLCAMRLIGAAGCWQEELMPHDYPDDWEHWLPHILKKIEGLANCETQIREMHDALYKNGLANKVSTLWEWRRDINKILITLIAALLIGLGGFIWNGIANTNRMEQALQNIEHQLKDLQR